MKHKAITLANFFRQPYPYYFTRQSLGKMAFGIFLLGFFFVYLFEPFNVNPEEQKMGYLWISVIHVGVAFIVFYVFFTVFNFLKPQEEKWTVGKEILSLAGILLIIGLINFLLRDVFYENPYNQSFSYLLEEVRNAFLIGMLLVLIIVPLNFARMYHRNARKAEKFHPEPKIHVSSSPVHVLIETRLKSDDFRLYPHTLVFAQAEGNYVEFHLYIDGKNKKLLKRMTIKDLELQLDKFPWLFKTHRSYLVNLHYVTEVSGNAQGYQLTFGIHPEMIPVSRGMIRTFDEAFSVTAL